MYQLKDVISYEQHKKIIEKANRQIEQQQKTIANMNSILSKASGILEAKFTRNNLINTIIALESLSTKGYMMKFVDSHIMKSAKTPNNYCGVIKKKCESTGRAYNGFNKIFNTFNNLPDWFVYETFKEKAIKSVPRSFSCRFKEALVAFILSQQKYNQRNDIH